MKATPFQQRKQNNFIIFIDIFYKTRTLFEPLEANFYSRLPFIHFEIYTFEKLNTNLNLSFSSSVNSKYLSNDIKRIP